MPEDNQIAQLREQVNTLRAALRQEIAARELLQRRVAQQENQIRELQRTTQNILHSRIWKTMVQLGGTILSLDQRRLFLQRRLRLGLGKFSAGSSREAIELHRDFPTVYSPPFSDKVKIQGWAIAESGIENIEVGVGGKLFRAISGLPRSDVAQRHASFRDADKSGFRAVVNVSDLPAGPHEITIYVNSREGNTAEYPFTIEVRHGGELRARNIAGALVVEGGHRAVEAGGSA